MGRGRGRGGGRPTTKLILQKDRVHREGDEAEFDEDDVVSVPCPKSNEMGKMNNCQSLKVDQSLCAVFAALSLRMRMI